jgi:hypothetical protein
MATIAEWYGTFVCLCRGHYEKHNELNLPILHGFRHFCFSISGHSCRFCLLLRTWTMLRPTSYFKIYISSTFSPLCQAASTRCQLWPAFQLTRSHNWHPVLAHQYVMPLVWREEPALWDGILEYLQRC